MKENKQGNAAPSGKKNSRRWISMLFGIAVGIGLGVFMVNRLPDDANFADQLVSITVLLLVFYAAMVVQIIVHEAGHMVFGLLSGYRFLSFRIYGLMWVKEEGRIRLKRMHLVGTAGQCLMAPPELVDGKMPVTLYNLGGVLMNLIGAVLFTVLYFLCRGVSLLGVFCLLCAVSGVLTALINGIPFVGGMINNDGRNLCSVRANPEAMKSCYVQLKVAEQTAKGVRMKDMPEAWFTVPEDADLADGMAATRGVFACNRLMDAGKWEEADRLISRLLTMDTGIVELHRRLLICDQIYLALTLRQDPAAAAFLLDEKQKKFMKSMRTFPTVLRTGYVYQLLGRRDVNGAEQVKRLFERCAKRYPYPVDIASERELMDYALQLSEEEKETEETAKPVAETVETTPESKESPLETSQLVQKSVEVVQDGVELAPDSAAAPDEGSDEGGGMEQEVQPVPATASADDGRTKGGNQPAAVGTVPCCQER